MKCRREVPTGEGTPRERGGGELMVKKKRIPCIHEQGIEKQDLILASQFFIYGIQKQKRRVCDYIICFIFFVFDFIFFYFF